ncbi:MAG TPA: ribosome biogenesis factor YjgA [Rhodocyclaceae bacterium]|uniref:ribosome biogenesis factor YjgA n=1 Tax=Zoogloea sp. TaxID=49181 RepID=UPI002C9B509A|nr:ribosome biogenesis factor YjgA [Zoogloea sp.]HMV17329.1 ribosome biogenesis factor YjgA [Rhodocyclaceae bacterium]HMV62396.1 ribosome biogenesis factor YjgA [Rhodocyclaceae bacterium]HMW50973.1 ribosome biogenesis factor YjgA [Rhodocyclaceae bacterium]HMZ75622.1 ribosome biogenesis factor YjgA [Rhodocyclaceae bacterium]HNA67495.1 ribosome biogenesis factor YjgA [Rhodocyclaceae bacterium]
MAHPHSHHDDDEDTGPSKSQLKRDSQALQELGQELAALGKERLAKVPLDEDLRDAVRDYQRFPSHEAKRRQLQYIGKLMRHVDPAPIRAALDAFKGVSAEENARMHRLEALRTRLLDDEKTLHDIATAHPGADLQHLRVLRRNALKERELGKPPRAFRELFRVLRELEGAPDNDPPSGDDEA